jgi:hypothetical protein
MKNKFVSISDLENSWVQEEADKREITFSDMLRRIIDDRYKTKSNKIKPSDNIFYHEFKYHDFKDGTNA